MDDDVAAVMAHIARISNEEEAAKLLVAVGLELNKRDPKFLDSQLELMVQAVGAGKITWVDAVNFMEAALKVIFAIEEMLQEQANSESEPVIDPSKYGLTV